MFDPRELSEQQRESIELQERPFQGTEISEPELPFSPGIRRPRDELEEPQGKSQRIDPDTEFLLPLRRYKGSLHCMLSRVMLRQ